MKQDYVTFLSLDFTLEQPPLQPQLTTCSREDGRRVGQCTHRSDHSTVFGRRVLHVIGLDTPIYPSVRYLIPPPAS